VPGAVSETSRNPAEVPKLSGCGCCGKTVANLVIIAFVRSEDVIAALKAVGTSNALPPSHARSICALPELAETRNGHRKPRRASGDDWYHWQAWSRIVCAGPFARILCLP